MRNPDLFDGQPVIEFTEEHTRRNFVRWAALVGVGGSLVAAGTAERLALAQTGGAAPSAQGDIEILNYALTLEHLEAEFYDKGVASGILTGRTAELVTPIRDHEAAHVSAIAQTVQKLGGQPVAKPNFAIPADTFTSRTKFLKTASTFEELGVTAYHGQVPRIQSPEVLGAAAAIAGVESRHAAILARLSGGDPFPRPVEAAASMQQVLAKAMPFIAK